jgi:hypothetical protein
LARVEDMSEIEFFAIGKIQTNQKEKKSARRLKKFPFCLLIDL